MTAPKARAGGVVFHHSPTHTVKELRAMLHLAHRAGELRISAHDFIDKAFGTEGEAGSLKLLRQKIEAEEHKRR